jgi:hypothetical protein
MQEKSVAARGPLGSRVSILATPPRAGSSGWPRPPRRQQFAPTGQNIPAQGKCASAPPWVANPTRQAPQGRAISRGRPDGTALRCGHGGVTYPARRACGACTGIRCQAPLGPIGTYLPPPYASFRVFRGKCRSSPRRPRYKMMATKAQKSQRDSGRERRSAGCLSGLCVSVAINIAGGRTAVLPSCPRIVCPVSVATPPYGPT